ncbi:MAG: hypothetical protein Q9216_006398 [Gyalolechia sp. 2 TL-2023]
MSAIFALIVFIVAAIVTASPIGKEVHPRPSVYTHTAPSGYTLLVPVSQEALPLPPLVYYTHTQPTSPHGPLVSREAHNPMTRTHTRPTGHGPSAPLATPPPPVTRTSSVTKVHTIAETHTVAPITTSHGLMWDSTAFGQYPRPTKISKRNGDPEPTIAAPRPGAMYGGSPPHSPHNLPVPGSGVHPLPPQLDPVAAGVDEPRLPEPRPGNAHGHGDPMGVPLYNTVPGWGGEMPYPTPRPAVPVVKTEFPDLMTSGFPEK